MEQHTNIPNEDPVLHWGFLKIKGSKVLDLGCGKFYSPMSTAEFFIKEGATKVVGVDLGDIGYENENFELIVEAISSSEQLQRLLDSEEFDIIKCDIEGAESFFEDITLPLHIKEFAVEYHDETTKRIMEECFQKWHFKDSDMYTLLGYPLDRIGVIHMK